MRRARRTAAAVTATLVLGLGLGVAGWAYAAPSASPSPSATSSPSAGAADAHGRPDRAGRQGDRGGLASALAEKLGLDLPTVRSALREYRQANRPTTRPAPDGTRAALDDAALAKALAEELDVPESDVAEAIAESRAERDAARERRIEDRLAEAVAAGTLTQAEADTVKKAADAGIVRVGRR